MEKQFILLSCLEWESGPVLLADSFAVRLRGLISQPSHGLLIKGPSVHSFGMRHSLEVVALTAALQVITVRHLRPRRVVTVLKARWLLELQAGAPTPEIGSTIVIG